VYRTANGSGLLSQAPAEAWAAFGLGNVGETLTQVLDAVAGTSPQAAEQLTQGADEALGMSLRNDVLPWMKEGVISVSGGAQDDFGGQLMVKSDDASATTSFVNRLQVLFGQLQGQANAAQAASAGGLSGWRTTGSEVPFTMLGGDRFVAGLGTRATNPALDGATLADDEVFTRATSALGDGYEPNFFLDADRARQQLMPFLEGSAGNQVEMDEVRRYVAPFDYMAAGIQVDGDYITNQFLVTLDDDGASN